MFFGTNVRRGSIYVFLLSILICRCTSSKRAITSSSNVKKAVRLAVVGGGVDRCYSHISSFNTYRFARTTATRLSTMASTTVSDDVYEETSTVVLSVLQNAVSKLGIGEDREGTATVCLEQAIQLLQYLDDAANSFSFDESTNNDTTNNSYSPKETIDIGSIYTLANTAQSTSNSLHQLVRRANQSKYRHPKKSSVHAWRGLQKVVGSAFGVDELPSSSTADDSVKIQRLSRAIALLALGILLSVQTSPDIAIANEDKGGEKATSKMVISAVFEGKLEKEEESEDQLILAAVRSAVVDLLHLAVSRDENTIELQVVAKLQGGFGLGEKQSPDDELGVAVSKLVKKEFESETTNEDASTRIISKNVATPLLALIASTRPWKYIEVDKAVSIAAENDLWFSAENICDAVMDSMSPWTTSDGKTATADFNDNLQSDSFAHVAVRAIVDIAFDHRLYRRADHFASKYYSVVGPQRYAQARFLHACDTIAKLVKKKQSQIIDKQVDRVDEAAKRAITDLDLSTTKPIQATTDDEYGDEIPLHNMSEHVREFSLRRLRAANMHSAAIRLANLWSMEYEHNAEQMMIEAKRRKLIYLQWNDEGCPGNDDAGGFAALPELISDCNLLFQQFSILEKNPERTVGFDCEWGDDVRALTSSKDGVEALKATVGKLFCGSTHVLHVIGFGCKEDFSRLRASPSADLWFPRNIIANDLRQLISETSGLGGKGGMHLGLSRACEHYLGKQLDKAEQCSDWSARPLSTEQREYAALDAWACAAIHAKIAETHKILIVP
ncbi:predicted protein [Thalassiosira pseudonana CCMP1335]|uniref:3'-5' exonuclease domain-containing protein n=1 Tax=Thalassiosira pseudonana TaxID=35128 RepID=B8BY18_THAPS|nr:predicted protein [Thalassiosira pseudonana CCMP1335]EED93809.1 predicted protein [Thalassiosira pseudonana CCMP1335]